MLVAKTLVLVCLKGAQMQYVSLVERTFRLIVQVTSQGTLQVNFQVHNQVHELVGTSLWQPHFLTFEVQLPNITCVDPLYFVSLTLPGREALDHITCA